jgi:hypothetical protein
MHLNVVLRAESLFDTILALRIIRPEGVAYETSIEDYFGVGFYTITIVFRATYRVLRHDVPKPGFLQHSNVENPWLLILRRSV